MKPSSTATAPFSSTGRSPSMVTTWSPATIRSIAVASPLPLPLPGCAAQPVASAARTRSTARAFTRALPGPAATWRSVEPCPERHAEHARLVVEARQVVEVDGTLDVLFVGDVAAESGDLVLAVVH